MTYYFGYCYWWGQVHAIIFLKDCKPDNIIEGTVKELSPIEVLLSLAELQLLFPYNELPQLQ